jgi:hypothetical protein
VTLQHIDRPPAGYPVGALVFFHGYSGDLANFVEGAAVALLVAPRKPGEDEVGERALIVCR